MIQDETLPGPSQPRPEEEEDICPVLIIGGLIIRTDKGPQTAMK